MTTIDSTIFWDTTDRKARVRSWLKWDQALPWRSIREALLNLHWKELESIMQVEPDGETIGELLLYEIAVLSPIEEA